ncbi:hypothetical protein Tco_0918303 [Tanacetum coccineum]
MVIRNSLKSSTTKYPRRWIKCSKESGLSLEEKWLRVQQKWPILLNGIKGMFIRHGPEIPKKARSKGGPRGTQRNIGIYTPYPRKDTFTPLIKSPKEILAMESVSFPEPPPLIKTPKKQNLNNFYGHHGDRGHNTNDFYQLKKQIEEVVASGKLAHLVKDICQNNQRNGSHGMNNVKVINMIRGGGSRKRHFKGERSVLTDELTFPAIPQNQLTDEPIILEGMIKVRQRSCMNIASEASMLTSSQD